MPTVNYAKEYRRFKVLIGAINHQLVLMLAASC